MGGVKLVSMEACIFTVFPSVGHGDRKWRAHRKSRRRGRRGGLYGGAASWEAAQQRPPGQTKNQCFLPTTPLVVFAISHNKVP